MTQSIQLDCCMWCKSMGFLNKNMATTGTQMTRITQVFTDF